MINSVQFELETLFAVRVYVMSRLTSCQTTTMGPCNGSLEAHR